MGWNAPMQGLAHLHVALMMTFGTNAMFTELSWAGWPMPGWPLFACGLLIPMQYLPPQVTPAGDCNAYTRWVIRQSPAAKPVEDTDTQ